MELIGPFHPWHLRVPSLFPGQVHFWFQHLMEEDGLIGYLKPESISEMNQAERIRFSRFHRPNDRALFAHCRINLRRICSLYTGIPAKQVNIGYKTHGKPYIVSQDGSHAALKFNISHSGRAFLAAFCLDREVGVDLEGSDIVEEGLTQSREICNDREIALLQSLPSASRKSAFLQIWVRKEAVAKSMGLGLSFPFSKIESAYLHDVPINALSSCVISKAVISCDESVDRSWELFSPLPSISIAAAIAVEADDDEV